MKKFICDYLVKYKKEFITLLIMFVVGVILGIIIYINNSVEVKESLNSLLNDSFINFKNNENINKLKLFGNSIKENVFLIIIISIVGTSIIGKYLVYLYNLYKGICIGYTISAIITIMGIKKGILICISSMFINDIVLMFSIILASINALGVNKKIYIRKNNFKENYLCYLIIMLIAIMLSIISSCIEAYFSISLLNFFKKII